MLSTTDEYDGKLGILERFCGANLIPVSVARLCFMEDCSLRMRSGEHRMPFPNLPVHHSRFCITGLDMQVLSVAGQDLYSPPLELVCVDEDATTVVVALEVVRYAVVCIGKSPFVYFDTCSSRTSFTSILEAGKGKTSADPRKEAQFAIADNTHLGIINFELALRAAIVASGAETQVRSTAVHVAADSAVALSIERAAVAQVSSTRKHEKCACAEPWLFDDDISCDRYHGISWREQPSQGVEAVADRLGGGAVAWTCISIKCVLRCDQ